MAYSEHALVSFRGFLGPAGNPLESWVIGLRFDYGSLGAGAGINQARLDDMREDFKTYFTNGAYDNSVSFTEARRYDIGPDGRAVGDILYSPLATPVRGGNASPALPWQCSLVVSLRTAKQRGRAHAGRVYLPPMCPTIGEDGLLEASFAQLRATQFAALLTSLNDPAGLQTPTEAAAVCVASKLDGSLEDVTAVRVGRVMDTMRSRRRSLQETYGALVGVS